MKKIVKLLSVTIIFVFLFSFISVEAEDTDKCSDSTECISVCQYKNGKYVIGVYATSDYKNYEIMYKEFRENGGKSTSEGGKQYDTKSQTGIRKFQDIFSKYADASSIENFEKQLCSKNAYYIKNKGDKIYFTCFDDDGKYCKEKYGDKVKRDYTVDESGVSVQADGRTSFETAEDRQEQKEKAISTLTENKIVIIDPEIPTPDGTCTGMFGEKVSEDIRLALTYIQYLGPILVIVLGILDFIKAVASGSHEEFNNAWRRLIKRLIIAILLFFIVTILKFVFKIFGIIVPADCLK